MGHTGLYEIGCGVVTGGLLAGGLLGVIFGFVRWPGTWAKMHDWGIEAHEKYLAARDDYVQADKRFIQLSLENEDIRRTAAAVAEQAAEANAGLAEWQQKWELREYEHDQQVLRLVAVNTDAIKRFDDEVATSSELIQQWAARDAARMTEIAGLRHELADRDSIIAIGKPANERLAETVYELRASVAVREAALVKVIKERDDAIDAFNDLKALTVSMPPNFPGLMRDAADLVSKLTDKGWAGGDGVVDASYTVQPEGSLG